MKKLVKYFSIAAVIFLITVLIVGVFYLKTIYQSFSNDKNLPPAVTAFLKRLTNQEPAPVSKPEDTIRILEGWTSRDIGQYFEENGRWQSDDFLKVAGFPQVDYRKNKDLPPIPDFSLNYSFLADKPDYYGLEGYLFPDTYRVYASSTVTEVVEKMLANFDQKLTPKMRADIKAQGKTIYEVVTLASIIEKEAPLNYQSGDNHDAQIISGIFLNRLRNGQALQSDATLSYIYGDNQPAHSGKELDADSPYNTYKYKGLPPGPICNPGILAIEAAIYPIKTDYNYFLTTDTGDVVYARTYDDHLRNKNKYLK
jgi:UPF0755 protein